jgi:hypothetical protein
MIEHAQISAYPCDLPTLQMQEADDVGQNLAIAVEVAGGAEEPYVAADAGEILAQLGKQAAGRRFVVVERWLLRFSLQARPRRPHSSLRSRQIRRAE